MFGGFFGGAPVGEAGLSNGFMFWRTDVTGHYVIGFRSEAGIYANRNVLVNPTELLIPTPATYGTTRTDSSRWVLSMNLNPTDVDTFYISTVSKTFLADAWGSLITPYGTFPDVLRLHEYAVKVDSVTATFGNTPVYSIEMARDTMNNYLYLTNTEHYPVAMVSADKNFNIRKVEYYNGAILTSIEEADVPKTALSVWPNPACDRVTVALKDRTLYGKGKMHIEIVDMMGRIVYSAPLQSALTEIELGTQLSGLHMVRIIENGTLIGNGKLLIAP
jgi:hypothetical protein